jgi:hypothetical protein
VPHSPSPDTLPKSPDAPDAAPRRPPAMSRLIKAPSASGCRHALLPTSAIAQRTRSVRHPMSARTAARVRTGRGEIFRTGMMGGEATFQPQAEPPLKTTVKSSLPSSTIASVVGTSRSQSISGFLSLGSDSVPRASKISGTRTRRWWAPSEKCRALPRIFANALAVVKALRLHSCRHSSILGSFAGRTRSRPCTVSNWKPAYSYFCPQCCLLES